MIQPYSEQEQPQAFIFSGVTFCNSLRYSSIILFDIYAVFVYNSDRLYIVLEAY